MKAQQQRIAPAAALWAMGALACVLVLATHFVANLYAALGLAAIGLALAAYLAGTQGPGIQALAAGLLRLQARKREFLFDEVGSWRKGGELSSLVADVVEYNMHRREYYRGAVYGVGTPFLLCDAGGIITHVSKAMLAFLKREEKDVVGKSVSEAFYNTKGASITEKVIADKADISKEIELVL